MKKLSVGGVVAAAMLVCLAFLWASPADAWWIFGEKPSDKITDNAAAIKLKEPMGTVNIDQIRAGEKELREKIRGMFQLTECGQAFGEYKRIHNTYTEKLSICNGADNAKRTEIEERAIRRRLSNMIYSDELYAMEGDCKTSCRALIEQFKNEASAAETAADNQYWDLRDQCLYEGPSLDSLRDAAREAEGIVCEKCDYKWPVETGDFLDPCYFRREMDEMGDLNEDQEELEFPEGAEGD